MKATTTINAATDRMIPNSVRNDRILCARNVPRATKMGSRKELPRKRAMLVKGYVQKTTKVPIMGWVECTWISTVEKPEFERRNWPNGVLKALPPKMKLAGHEDRPVLVEQRIT